MSEPTSPERAPDAAGVDFKVGRFVFMGALGCLAGAVLGELLLLATHNPVPKVPPQAICLLIDCSGSMLSGSRGGELTGQKLLEVKAAASRFVGRQDLKRDAIAVVGFGSRSQAFPLTQDLKQLNLAIQSLADGGSTAMHAALPSAASALLSQPQGPRDPAPIRTILLFTDGQPDNPMAALEAANVCRQQQIKLVAIGTGDANVPYLGQLTGDPKLVFGVAEGNYAEGFRKAEEAIYGPSLVESAATRSGLGASMLKTAAWTALLAIGVSLALIAGQNRYLRRPLLSPGEAVVGGLGGLAAGAVGGAAGQLFFSAALGVAHVPVIGFLLGWLFNSTGRIVGWAILGALVGRGLAFFVPNLDRRRAWIGGLIGGAAGALAFLVASLFGDLMGRFLGAAVLGAFIGAMIAWMEAAGRLWWLEVRLGQKETVKVNLGDTPVRIGSDNRRATIYARGARPLAAQYRVVDGRVEYIDMASEQARFVEPGDQRTIGHVTVIVRAAAQAAGSSAGERPAEGAADSAPRPAAAPPPPKSKKSAGPERPPSSPAAAEQPKAQAAPQEKAPAPTTAPPSTPPAAAPTKPAGQVLSAPPPPKPKSPSPPGSGPAQRTIRPVPPPKP